MAAETHAAVVLTSEHPSARRASASIRSLRPDASEVELELVSGAPVLGHAAVVAAQDLEHLVDEVGPDDRA